MSSSSSATSLFKPMAESCVLSSSSPYLFTAKSPYPFLSFPSKVIRLHLSSAFSIPSLSPKKKKNIAHSPSSSIITLVAQTSDWAQQEDNTLTIDREEESSWEPEGEDSVAASNEAEAEGGEEEEGSYAEPPEDAKLFVGNLPYDIDSDKLAQIFEKAGTVEIAEVIYNRETDQSRGFGFVTLSTVEEAEKAVDIFSRYELNGRQLTVNKAAPRGAREERPPRVFEPAFRIYVGNLPWNVDNSQLEQVFSEHGKVVDARVVFDRETGRSRGFGFVTMADETEMNDAIAALDGQSLDGRAIRVNVAEERPMRRSF